MKLPDGTGIDLLSFIRRNNIPLAVIILTGYGDEETATQSMKAGADNYIAKKGLYYPKVGPAIYNAILQRRKAEKLKETPIRVLYVEHNPADIELTNRYVERYTQNIHIETVQTSQEALEKIPISTEQIDKYDLLLLDYRMPRINAIELLKIVVEDRKLDLPVIIITGQGDEEIAVNARRLGAVDYIVKDRNYLMKLVVMIENAYYSALVKRQNRQLQFSNMELNKYFDYALDLLSILDLEGRFVRVNNRWVETFEYAIDEILNKRIIDFIHPDDRKAAMEKIDIMFSTGNVLNQTNRWISKHGMIHWVEWRSYRIEDKVYSIARDITDRKQQEDSLIYLSNHDHLTKLYNRRFFEEELKRLDTEENLPISIIMSDVNGLKLVNDSFGHAIGDDFLKAAAEIIRNSCRADDIVARLGGDEFAVILPKTDTVEAQQILNSIKNLAADTKITNVELSISVGCDIKEKQEQSIIEIFASAENYMYKHKLNERLSMRSKTIDLIMKALFEKSNREMLHSKRVSVICEAIGVKMNYNKDEIGQIRIAGLVHDIGKIGIEERILNKNGKLDHEEWKEMRKHSEMGWRILSSTNEFSELANIVIAHHERWDGGGYPNGLKGEEIPMEARIITIADSYDAMTSERVYRKSLTEKEAAEELRRCSGTQFDPRIAEVFLNLVLPYDSDFEVKDTRLSIQ